MGIIKQDIGKYKIVGIGEFGIINETVATITKTDNTVWKVEMTNGECFNVAAYSKEDAIKTIENYANDPDRRKHPHIGFKSIEI